MHHNTFFNARPNADPFLHVDMAAPVMFNGNPMYLDQTWTLPSGPWTKSFHFFFRPLPASRLPRPGDLATEEVNDRMKGTCYLITDQLDPCHPCYPGEPESTRQITLVHTINRRNTRDAMIWRMIKLKLGIGPHHMWNTIWDCVEQWLIAPHRLIVPPEAAQHLVLDGVAEAWSYYGAGEYYINKPVVFATEKHYHNIGGFVAWNGLCMHCVNNVDRIGNTCERLDEHGKKKKKKKDNDDSQSRKRSRGGDDDDEEEE